MRASASRRASSRSSSSVGADVRFRIIAVLAVTFLCLVWVLWGLDLQHAFDAVRDYRIVFLVPALGIFFLTLYMRYARFHWILGMPLPARSLMSIVAVSFLAINVVPLRMGELVRPYLLAEKHDVPLGVGVAAVVMERLCDLLSMLGLLAAVGLIVDLPEGGIELGGVDLFTAGARTLGISAVLGLFVAVGVAVVGRPSVVWLARQVGRVSAGLAQRVESLGLTFVEGIHGLARRPRALVAALSHSAGIWVLTLVAVGSIMAGFEGLSPTVERVLFNWAATMSAMVLFPTPGFVGPFEAASTESLVLMGSARELATSFALLMHATMFGFTVLSGVFFMFSEGWSLTTLVKASRKVSNE